MIFWCALIRNRTGALFETLHAHADRRILRSCHKVHLDVPVNHYRWVRGFNEYDNWQASGVSGKGHALLLPGQLHDVRRLPHAAGALSRSREYRWLCAFAPFSCANTAGAHGNQDQTQLELSQKFLQTSNSPSISLRSLRR